MPIKGVGINAHSPRLDGSLFDFLESIELARPLIKDVHIHDDFGKPAGLDRRQIMLLSQGKGDLHMPIGWGEIPYREVFSRLDGLETLWIDWKLA
jgi:sugar phosphate isomerase/epimerase